MMWGQSCWGSPRTVCWGVAITWSWLLASCSFAAPMVDLEIAARAGNVTGPQEWSRALDDVPELGQVRIRTATADDQATAERLDSNSKSVNWRVVAILNVRNELELPGGARLHLGETRRLSHWIEQLDQSNQPGRETDATEAPEKALGLTDQQLATTVRQMSPAVVEATNGKRVAEFVADVRRQLGLPLRVVRSGAVALEQAEPIGEEYQGLSCGTALAAALRPAGLALTPVRDGERAVLEITSAKQADAIWPIGWPSDRSEPELLPPLFRTVEVQIDQTPLDDAIRAIAQRIDTPVLIDINGLTAAQIDLTKVAARFPRKKSSYRRILGTILQQGKLELAVRLDDAGKPFVWIQPLRH